MSAGQAECFGDVDLRICAGFDAALPFLNPRLIDAGAQSLPAGCGMDACDQLADRDAVRDARHNQRMQGHLVHPSIQSLSAPVR